MWKDAKYLMAYITPLAAYLGIAWGGWWSLGSIYIGFGLIPLLEIFAPQSDKNLTNAEEEKKVNLFFYDLLLYLNIPILYSITFFYFYTITQGGLSIGEQVGMTFNVGLLLGTMGINVAHELGHRPEKHNRFAAKLLLLPSLYLHFIIEHNRGHHKQVATPEDPATARLGEHFYAFWFRSVTGGYLNAWKLEAERLRRQDASPWGWNNQMVRFQVYQLAYISTVIALFGGAILPYLIGAAIGGFTLLEMVNYIEHYGLQRNKLPSGKYEKVRPVHSWNSNHEFGRIFLYELTRHSDHHYKATRKFQVLRHIEESPQLPYGYPTSIIISLVPPLWFWMMNREVSRHQQRISA